MPLSLESGLGCAVLWVGIDGGGGGCCCCLVSKESCCWSVVGECRSEVVEGKSMVVDLLIVLI